jgi:HTH-type transcriptional regulator/antitoxin HigA
MSNTEFYPDIAIHPGHTIAKALKREGMNQKSLSARTGLTEKHLSQIINGKASITVETALLLENALGGTASFWINLEKNYQETNARLERLKLVKKEIGMLSKFPYKELAQRSYVKPTTSREEKVINLWKFFGVNSLNFVQNTEAVSYRKKDGLEVKSEAIAAWLRCGEIESRKVILPEYSKHKLQRMLEGLKLLSVKNPEEYSVEVVALLKNAGVALVYIPHFAGIGVSGAVRWIGKNPIIQLSIYYRWADIFWFNLYHEIGHLLLHDKKDQFIEFENKDLSTAQDEEHEADKFASDKLIPENKYSDFINKPIKNRNIVDFACSLGIHPGIVAGRLCHDGLVPWHSVSKLRPRLECAN